MDIGNVKVAVLAGGDSQEREVSLRSGTGVHQALVRRGLHADLVTVDEYDGLPQRLRGYGAVFSVLHGGAGEDGTVQLLLDLLRIPYVGSGPGASAKAMDKVEAYQRFRAAGLTTPEWTLVKTGAEQARIEARLDTDVTTPLVVKPRREGSSLGVHLVEDPRELLPTVTEIGQAFGDVLVEPFVPGRELTVAVLEDDDHGPALPVVELVPRGQMFDFTAKYAPGNCTFVCPTELAAAEFKAVRDAAVTAHNSLGCRDLSRVDIRLRPEGTPVVLEVNTLPGMTEMSTFPRAAAAAGVPYDALVERLLFRALSRLPEPAALG